MGGTHLVLTLLGGFISLGAAVGAQRPWADSAWEHVVTWLTFVLLVPLSLLNATLPRHLAPGFPVSGVVLTSVLWGAVAGVIAHRRR